MKLSLIALLLLCVALVQAEPRVPQRADIVANNAAVAPQHPYLFLTVPRGRSNAVVQGFEVLRSTQDDDEDEELNSVDVYDDEDEYEEDERSEDEEDDDEDAEEDGIPERNPIALKIEAEDALGATEDDEDDEFEDEIPLVSKKPQPFVGVVGAPSKKGSSHLQLVTKNAKQTHMMVSRDQAGAIMVPDGVIEIEGQSVIDQKTGKTALLVPRDALDAIPNGSVVALMARSLEDKEEERANRVVVRRRRKNSRRNVRRRGSNKRRRGGKRRRNNKRRNVRVVQVGGTRRRGNRRRGGSRRPMVIQG